MNRMATSSQLSQISDCSAILFNFLHSGTSYKWSRWLTSWLRLSLPHPQPFCDHYLQGACTGHLAGCLHTIVLRLTVITIRQIGEGLQIIAKTSNYKWRQTANTSHSEHQSSTVRVFAIADSSQLVVFCFIWGRCGSGGRVGHPPIGRSDTERG